MSTITLAQKKEQAAALQLAAIKKFKAVYAGVSTPDYFPGASIYSEKLPNGDFYTEVYTGIGDTPQAAWQDAQDMAADRYDTAFLPVKAKGLGRETVASYYRNAGVTPADDTEAYCYVLLYILEA
jgi:hypothetical protein